MARRYLIIDGYNFLHATGLLAGRVTPALLEQARRRMFALLESRLSAGERERTRIVFDVRRNRGGVPPRQSAAGMTIHNAVEHADADTLIEQLIREHAAPKQLLVVSGDHRLHRAARARKARAIDSEDFYAQLLQRPHRKRSDRSDQSTTVDHNADSSCKPAFPAVSAAELALWEQRIQELLDE